jgi:hypothetical protein
MRGAVSIALAYNKVIFEPEFSSLESALNLLSDFYLSICLSTHKLRFILVLVNHCSLQHLVILRCELMLS